MQTKNIQAEKGIADINEGQTVKASEVIWEKEPTEQLSLEEEKSINTAVECPGSSFSVGVTAHSLGTRKLDSDCKKEKRPFGKTISLFGTKSLRI